MSDSPVEETRNIYHCASFLPSGDLQQKDPQSVHTSLQWKRQKCPALCQLASFRRSTAERLSISEHASAPKESENFRPLPACFCQETLSRRDIHQCTCLCTGRDGSILWTGMVTQQEAPTSGAYGRPSVSGCASIYCFLEVLLLSSNLKGA